ncbi:PAS-domain containing protein [Roseovarius sp. C7]|uniref:PAS-domain containing protein n=1 Tax=Roseovarius sp. C7 TaxID=3398643 RepID=UPI0039F73FD1
MTLSYLTWITTIATATAAVCLVLCLVSRIPRRSRAQGPGADDGRRDASDETVFLFAGTQLIDTDKCSSLTAAGDGFDWAAFRHWLLPRFPAIPELPAMIRGRDEIAARDDPAARLVFEPGPEDTPLLRVRLRDKGLSDPSQRHDLRLQMLKGLDHIAQTQDCPFPMWRLDRDGRMVWRNDACTHQLGTPPDLDLPPADDHRCDHISIAHTPDGPQQSFDVHTVAQTTGFARYAIDTTDTRIAEAARTDFIQTLTKTFAHLTIGLAVFDQRRQLMLFNPALTDLTRLPPEFLATRPDLTTFFDQLRNGQMMPEPRSYAEWRRQIDDMLTSAADGLYQENWALPSSVTYRVTGRPHPDGAVAFFFEDITATVQQSRRHQSEMAIRDAMIEGLDQAAMIVGSDNRVSLCNTACRALLGLSPDAPPDALRLADALKAGQAALPHPRFWNELNKLIHTTRTRATLGQGPVRDDRPLAARVLRLPDGARMILIGPENGAALALSA